MSAELQQRILELVNSPDYQPAKPRVIAKRLRLSAEQAEGIKRVVKRMARQGLLVYGGNRVVQPIKAAAAMPRNRVIGVFHRTQKGFGFVRPRSGSAIASLKDPNGTVRDIYIPAKRAGDASTGDVVVVELLRRRRDEPGARGEIVEIIERQTQRFVGTYFERGGAALVQVDGTVFAAPIAVGDPGAKGARPEDKVVIEMLRFPSPVQEGEGVIVEVLGPRGKPGVDTLSIIREFDLPDEFAPDALDEARAAAAAFDENDLAGRLDLTGETVITIDPIDARDFDDAISLVKLDDGRWRLGVHIADVSHFVRPRTALDREAYSRGTSVYLPDRVLPMLPETISNGLASLQPDKVRYTKTALMEFSAEGLRTDATFHHSAIRSCKRLTYEQVDEYLANRAAGRRKLGRAVADLLDRMVELAMVLRGRRRRQGALEINMPEVKIDLDEQGRVNGAHVVENTVSHQIIEEFMLAANGAVAEFLQSKGVPFLRRIHAAPSPIKLQALAEFLKALRLKHERLESRFELQRLLDEFADKPERHAVHFAVLRSLQQAYYGPEELGHYALAIEHYCHFTSPIRRYPDLTIHRTLDALIRGVPPRADFDQLVVVGQHCSQRERRAEEAERDLTKLKLLSYLNSRIGEEMDALVTGVEPFGLFVQGIALPAEGLVRAESLVDDYYVFDREGHCLAGRRSGRTYRLGDKLRVAVARVDLERRTLDFRLSEGRTPHGRGGAKARRAPAPKGYLPPNPSRGRPGRRKK